MTTITVPSSINLKQASQWSLATTTISGGLGLDGRTQRIRRENRTWACTYIVLDAWGGEAGQGAYMAFLDEINGAANTFTVEVPQPGQIVSTSSTSSTLQGNMFLFEGNNMLFDTGTNNAIFLDGDPNPGTSAFAAAAASIIQTSGADGLVLRVGDHFSHNDFLYRISANDGGTISFNPPLRAAIASGQTLEVLNPKIRVRLSDDSAAATAHQFSQWGAPYTMTLIEAFER